ncbi:MAG: 3-hydroxyacyl-ACP dehydratase [Bacteroidetes bacterium]|nr:3-hydroxyacyl-ACP dehydratase [Bacteroidota bacterium]
MIEVGQAIVNSDSILNYIPQRPPIVLVSRIYKCDDQSVVTGFDIAEGHIFVKNGKLLEPGVIENMAQTAASAAGFKAVAENTSPAVGFIGNIKNLSITHLPAVGKELITEVSTKTQVMNVSLVEARSYCDGRLVASCEMKIFLQENA